MDTEGKSGFRMLHMVAVAVLVFVVLIVVSSKTGMLKCNATHGPRGGNAIVCRNRLRGTYAGFVYYSVDHNDVYIAPWDRSPRPGIPAGYEHATQWPYTMAHYVTGGGVPLGEQVYDDRAGGWYTETGRQSSPPFASPTLAPQLQCPEMVRRGRSANPLWYDFTSYSYAIIGGHTGPGGRIVYTESDYPTPDVMTHVATTVLMMDMAFSPASGGLSPASGGLEAWVGPVVVPSRLHHGETNVLFVDGHVEALRPGALTPAMWESLGP